MQIPVLFMLVRAIAPTIGNARISFDSLKEGAARAASAVGETTGSAVDAAGEVAGTASGAFRESVEYSTQSLGDEATPEATRGKLDAMATRTLVRLFAERPDSRDLFDRSAGYAVFDKREASFYLVAGYGRGVAVAADSDARVYMKMATTGGSLSFGLGGFASHVVILFENSAELDEFIARGLDAAAEVGTMAGEQKDQFALRFNDGKAVFLLTNSGWKVEAKLTGSRYWPDKALNPQAN